MLAPPKCGRLFLAGAALALAAVAAGCTEDDVTQADLSATLVDDGVPAEVADCVADRIFGQLDQGEVNDLYGADEPDEAGQDAVDAAVAACT